MNGLLTIKICRPGRSIKLATGKQDKICKERRESHQSPDFQFLELYLHKIMLSILYFLLMYSLNKFTVFSHVQRCSSLLWGMVTFQPLYMYILTGTTHLFWGVVEEIPALDETLEQMISKILFNLNILVYFASFSSLLFYSFKENILLWRFLNIKVEGILL